MCLTLIGEDQQPKIAEEDIVVYKFLKNSRTLSSDVKHGDFFEAIVVNNNDQTIHCKGMISIENGNFFLCTDVLDGLQCKNKLGYHFSWVFADSVKSVKINGEEKILSSLSTPYQEFPVEIGKTYLSDLTKKYDEIYKGLHSFKSLDFIKRFVNVEVVVKCIIPKGSTYYKGEFGNCVSYASDTLTYVEEIFDFK